MTGVFLVALGTVVVGSQVFSERPWQLGIVVGVVIGLAGALVLSDRAEACDD